MGFLQRLERGLDRGVSRVFSAGHSEIKPLELAQGLRRECDDQIQVLDRTRTLAPNIYVIYMNSEDYSRFASWEATLVEQLESGLIEHATGQSYIFAGPVAVSIEADDEVRAGMFETESRTEHGAVTPATGGDPGAAGRHPILEIDGQQYMLTGPVTLIGRGGDADIILEDTGVSRHHLELRADPDGGATATDLGSTNGTFVNGERIRTPVRLTDRSLIVIGRTRMGIQLPSGANPPVR